MPKVSVPRRRYRKHEVEPLPESGSRNREGEFHPSLVSMDHNATLSCTTYEQLQALVHQLLCQQAVLEPGETPLQASVLYRRQRPCAVLFHIEGPRQIRPSAIWVAREQRLLLYDSRGNRLGHVRLHPAPPETVLQTLAQQSSNMPTLAQQTVNTQTLARQNSALHTSTQRTCTVQTLHPRTSTPQADKESPTRRSAA